MVGLKSGEPATDKTRQDGAGGYADRVGASDAWELKVGSEKQRRRIVVRGADGGAPGMQGKE